MNRLSLVLLVVIALLSICPIQAAEPNRTFVSGNYMFVLDSVKCGFVKSMSGGGISAEVIKEQSGPTGYIKKHIGVPIYEEFSIDLGFSMASPVYNWISESWNQSTKRHNGSVMSADYQLNAKSEREFVDAFITETTIPACDGSSKEPSYLTVKFAPQSIRYKELQGTKVTTDIGRNDQKVWTPNSFILNIDGLDCTKVSKIDSFTIKQATITNNVGDAREYLKEPGKLEFPNLRITLSESDAESWIKWHEEFVIKGNNDESFEKNGTLVFLSSNRQKELARIRFYNLGIFKLEPEKHEANADNVKRITAELYCERMEFDATGSGDAAKSAAEEEKPMPPDGKGEWGKTYSMRQTQPLYFTLLSADYSVYPKNIGKAGYTLSAEEKFLTLHFTVQNPGTTERLVRYDQLPIFATDSAGRMFAQKQAWGYSENKALMAANLAPNKKISLDCIISVPAKGEPKNILVKSNRENDGPELVYDVSGHVPALTAPFVDASDPTGATALEEIPANLKTAYPCKNFSITVNRMEYTTSSIGEYKVARGQRFLVCPMVIKNHTIDPHLVRHDMIQPALVSQNNERMIYKGMVFIDNGRPVAQEIGPGEEIPVRILFTVPDGVNLKQLMIQENKSRRYIYKVS